MSRIFIWAGTVAVVALLGTHPVVAGDFTGDPSSDGWTFHGNSLSSGTYIRGIGGWSFDVYSDAFVLQSGDALVDGANWLVGDQIIALGGVYSDADFIAPRLVAKFGAAGSIFSASTLGSPFGNGAGSFSNGDGGLGSVQVDFEYVFDNGGNLGAGQNGVIWGADFVRYYNGSSTLINSDYGRVLGLFTGNDLDSWEVALNLSALSDPSRGNKGSVVPLVNGKSDMALQPLPLSDLPNYTDGLVDRSAIPEPSAGLLVLISVIGSAWLLRRH